MCICDLPELVSRLTRHYPPHVTRRFVCAQGSKLARGTEANPILEPIGQVAHFWLFVCLEQLLKKSKNAEPAEGTQRAAEVKKNVNKIISDH